MADGAQLSTGLRRGTLEFCVLAMVEHEDRYGTEIVRRLGDEPNLAASEGTIYPLLSRLRRAGWLDSKWSESPSGPPRRLLRADRKRSVGAGAVPHRVDRIPPDRRPSRRDR